MTNGIGATVGTLGAQAVVNRFVDMNSSAPQMEGWSMTWFVFAGYALAVAVLFAVIFKYKHRPGKFDKLFFDRFRCRREWWKES